MSRIPNLSVPFDLRQKHVRVSREKVVNQFLSDIRAMAVAKATELYPGKDIFVDNGPDGAGLAWHDITMTLKEIWLSDGSEEKTNSSSGRKQRNWAKGYARFEVTEHVSGGPKVTDPNAGRPDYASVFDAFARAYGGFVDKHIKAAFPIPCELTGGPCPSDRDPILGPPVTWPLGYGYEVVLAKL